MAIEAEYLAALRRRLRCELVLTMVQLEQLCPGWWLTLSELAEQMGTDRTALNRAVRKLEDLGLLRRASISNSGGTFIWWVKRCESDEPGDDAEPAWMLRDLETRRLVRVPMGERWQWADRRGIPRPTMQGFLGGYQGTLYGRWRVVSTPMDMIVKDCDDDGEGDGAALRVDT